MATRDKNIWILLVFLLSGLVIGGLLRRSSKTGGFFMVAILWTRIWFIKSNYIKFKCNKPYIWANV